MKQDNTQETSVYEFLHDELAINLEPYPEGYLSKLERAWIFGKQSTVHPDWNQQRYSDKWNGQDWETDLGRKWTFKRLHTKMIEKQVERRNDTIKRAITELIDQDEDF